MTALWLIVTALAAYRVTRLLIRDDFPPVMAVRSWLLDRWPGDLTVFDPSEVDVRAMTVHATGVPVAPIEDDDLGTLFVAVAPHWIGNLIECPWCLGFWVSLAAVVGLYYLGDQTWFQVAAAAFATSAVVGLLWSTDPA